MGWLHFDFSAAFERIDIDFPFPPQDQCGPVQGDRTQSHQSTAGVAVEVVGALGVVDPARTWIGRVDEQAILAGGQERPWRQGESSASMLNGPGLLLASVCKNLQPVLVVDVHLTVFIRSGYEGLGRFQQIATVVVVDRGNRIGKVICLQLLQQIVGFDGGR